MIKRLSVKTIMKFNPCYTEDELKALWGKTGLKKTVGIIDFLNCSYEKKDDLIWTVLRPEIISEKNIHELACDFAELSLMNERKNGREPHIDSWNVIKVKRLWITGKATDEELTAAWSAARSVAESAAWLAAESAARSAARSAAWSAAESAAESAAWSAARSEQIQIIIKKLEAVK